MGSSIFKQAAKFLREQKTYKRWLSVFLCLALFVALGTVTALKYTGQAASYEQKVLSCGLEVHKHTQGCYDQEGKLVCGQADYVVHVHNDDCYDEAGNLVCKLPAVKEHKHDASCYQTKSTLICTKEESAGHVHGDACYTRQVASVLCTLAEHSHGDSCYDEAGALVCTQEEHQHNEACYSYDNVLTCTLEEGADAHTHTDACYQTEKVLACGKLENHTHDKKTCYDKNGALICDKTVLEEHIHNNDCFETVKLSPEEVAARNSAAATEAPQESETPAPKAEVFFTEDSTVEDGAESGDSELLTKGSDLAAMGSGKVKMGVDMETKTFEGADFTISVSYTADANIPEEAELHVEELLPGTDEYDEYIAQALEALEVTEEDPAVGRLFDISFMLDGKEIEPEDTVDVAIYYLDDEGVAKNAISKIVHFAKEAEQPEVIDVDVVGKKYCFSADSFSVFYAARAATEYTITFNSNGGSKNTSVETVNGTFVFPEAPGTRDGYAFVGWSEDKEAATKHMPTIFEEGASGEATKKTTYYAIWGATNQDARFYVSVDGQIHGEPNQSPASSWTPGISIDGAIPVASYFYSQQGVDQHLNITPTATQLATLFSNVQTYGNGHNNKTIQVKYKDQTVPLTQVWAENGKLYGKSVQFNKMELYVRWYVIKKQAGGYIFTTDWKGTTSLKSEDALSVWHVDGVLLVKDEVTVTVTYEADAPTFTKLPGGYSCEKNTEITVGANGTPKGTVWTPERSDGYTFTGWKMYTVDDNGNRTYVGDYSPNDKVSITDNTVFVAQWKRDTVALKVIKTDGENKVLSDAEFNVTNKTNMTTNKDGIAEFGLIEVNQTYTVQEITAPTGYVRRETPIYFKINKQGDTREIQFLDANGNALSEAPEGVKAEIDENNTVILTVVNTQVKAKVNIIKVANDNTSTTLSGATFTLDKVNDETFEPQTLTSGENGVIEVNKDNELPYGTYTLTETKAPDGYNLLTEPVKIQVDQNGVVTATYKNGTLNVTENEGVYTIQVINDRGYALPETGGAGTTLYTFGGIAILAFGLMYGCSLRRKRERGSAEAS